MDNRFVLGLTGFTYDQIDRVLLEDRLNTLPREGLSSYQSAESDWVTKAERRWRGWIKNVSKHLGLREVFKAVRSSVVPRETLREIWVRVLGPVHERLHWLMVDQRLSTPAKRRRDWLMRQFEASRLVQSADFDPQPHAHLAQVYRKVGRADDAREITYDKLLIEARLSMREVYRNPLFYLALGVAGLVLLTLAVAGDISWIAATAILALAAGLRWLIYAGFRFGFGFGLYWIRALATFGICLLIGGIAVHLANGGTIGPFGPLRYVGGEPIMELEVTAVNDTVIQNEKQERFLTFVMPSTPTSNEVASIPCRNAINPLLYAADVFVPLIDLGQESKCSPGASYTGWLLAKALYEFLGWIVTSLTILTATGVLRSRSES